MQFKSIKMKISVMAGLCLFIALGVVITYSASSMLTTATETAENQAIADTQALASEIGSELSSAMVAARSMAQSLSTVKDGNDETLLSRDQVLGMLQSVLVQNPDFLGTYTAWEPDAFDGLDATFTGTDGTAGNDETGRFVPYVVQGASGVMVEPLAGYEDQTRDENGVRAGEYYLGPKDSKVECAIDPYIYPVDGVDVLLTSFTVPIMKRGRFYGMAGVDIGLATLQDRAEVADIFQGNGALSIVSNLGIIAAAAGHKEAVGHHLKTLLPDSYREVVSAISSGETKMSVRDGVLMTIVPFHIGQSSTPWGAVAQIPMDVVTAEAEGQMWQLIGLGVGFVAAGLAFLWMVAGSIGKPISSIAQVAENIAAGDIQHNIDHESKDEIGVLAESFRKLIDYMKGLATAAESIADNDLTIDVEPKSDKDVLGISFKTMTTNLTTMIRQMGDNSTQLVSAASEVASSSEQMSRGARDQTDQTAQVSTAVEEMTATIVESSKNAGEATEGAKGAADTATTGGQIVNETIQGMQRIANVVRESADSIGKLAKSADQIGEIIGVIDDIADQTNLLALNAAIEAARAGEQGRGFAVVADEVRKLAERTGKATGEITGMIKGIQEETNEAVGSMETGITEVDAGRELADKAGTSLTEIVNLSQSVQDMIAQIATAAEEQSSAAEQISKNVENVSSIAKESAKGAEQSATAAEELNRQAEGMQQMVAKFKIKQDAQ